VISIFKRRLYSFPPPDVACSLEFSPPFVRPMSRGEPPFEQTGGRPMRRKPPVEAALQSKDRC
jgi:hypothetical protein